LIGAHIVSMGALEPGAKYFYNLGIGQGYSVRQIIEAARRVTGRELKVEVGERRPGDPPELYADPSKIASERGWKAQITDVGEIIESAWRWFRDHPDGYAK
jgi:UDP-glucose 4-epimerase